MHTGSLNNSAQCDVFSATLSAETEHRIEARVQARIERARVFRMRMRGAADSAIAAAAIVGLVPATSYISSQAAASGFSGYASLFITDTGYAFSNLKGILLSLAESMPTLGILLALGTLIVFGSFAGRAARTAAELHRKGGMAFA